MVERLQADASTPLPLEQHLQKVETALAEAMENPGSAPSSSGAAAGGAAAGAAASGGGEDPMTDALITTPVTGAGSMFISVYDQMNSSNGNPLAGGSKNTNNSHFIGGSGYSEQRKPTPTPLIPMTYAEKKMAVKRTGRAAVKSAQGGVRSSSSRGASVFASERLALASMSLTGGSLTDKKKTPMKGAKVNLAVAQAMGFGSLVQELNVTLREMQGLNRYDKDPKRLELDLREGKASAEAVVQNSPQIAAKLLRPHQ
ncbi:MAG: hypothetical protein KGL10_04910 [Alphaproteobacteria bacterium]|nr:hypothetical protein [Alphaproteobacteria bacterium]